MNKFAKAILLAIVFAAPIAISAPAVQAKTATTDNTAATSVKSNTVTKAYKHRIRKHHKRYNTTPIRKSAVKPTASTSK